MTSKQCFQPNHEGYLVHCADAPAVLSVGREYGMLSNVVYYICNIETMYIFQPSRVLLLISKNIESYATFLSSTFDMRERVIYFGPGDTHDGTLLNVPIGMIDPQAAIVVTVGLNKTHLNNPSIDSHVGFGISDGTFENLFYIRDANDYTQFDPIAIPCHQNIGTSDLTYVSSSTPVSDTFKLTFIPHNQFGFCETAQEGGYINTATFLPPIDVTKPLFLTARRNLVRSDFYFHYIKVEIYDEFRITTF